MPMPMRYALCPMPYALCPMPYALCPMPARAPHVTEKGYISILAGASIHFDWARRPARLTSQGDMCYGASAISGLNLHIPSSKS